MISAQFLANSRPKPEITGQDLSPTCKNVKLSHRWSGEALRLQEVEGSRISRQSAHEGSKVVSPTHRPLLPPQTFLLETELTAGK
jgi:hypothetical protein